MKNTSLLLSLIGLVLVVAAITGCGGGSGDNGGTAISDVNGLWGGTTSQGEAFYFSVENNAIPSFFIEYDVPSCSTYVSESWTFNTPKTISGNTFSIQLPDATSVNGTFNSDNAVSGTYSTKFSSYYGCSANVNVNWTAQKGASLMVPKDVTATAGSGQVSIKWDDVFAATSYDIYWSTTSGVSKSSGTKISSVTSPFIHTGLTNGSPYYYVVVAVSNSYGESSESAQVSATPLAGPVPSAPVFVTATAGNGQTTVSWMNVSGTTSYNLYWSTTSGVTKSNGTKISGVTTPYAHTGLTNGTSYYYVVTAVNSNGESIESAEVSATPSVGPVPSAPTGVTAAAENGQATVSWSNVSGATSYNLYWSTTSGVTKSNGTKISAVTAPYAHTGLTKGTTYYYVVTAVNGNGESIESSQVSAAISPWQISVIDSIGVVGSYSSIAIDSNNKIHISYFDETNMSLKYATNASGAWNTASVDSVGNVGKYSSIAVDSNNKIHISYYEYVFGDLKYATNASGSWETAAMDTAGDVGKYPSIAVDSNNKVHISYYDGTNYDIKYASNASGSWMLSSIASIGNVGNVGQYTSLAIDSNNKAHISSIEIDTAGPMNSTVQYFTNSLGSWATTTVGSINAFTLFDGQYQPIVLDSNNKAHIAYNYSGLRYATNTLGLWNVGLIDNTVSYFGGISIAIDTNDKVHICYAARTCNNCTNELKYATNASGSWIASTIGNAGYAAYASIAVDSNNKVHISYFDSTSLKYITNE